MKLFTLFKRNLVVGQLRYVPTTSRLPFTLAHAELAAKLPLDEDTRGRFVLARPEMPPVPRPIPSVNSRFLEIFNQEAQFSRFLRYCVRRERLKVARETAATFRRLRPPAIHEPR
jgi:hypothetical protein